VGAAQHIGDTNLYALAVAVAVFTVVVAAERVNRRLPGALIGVILSLAASAAFDLAAKGVATPGHAAGRPGRRTGADALHPSRLAAAAQRPWVALIVTHPDLGDHPVSFAELGGL